MCEVSRKLKLCTCALASVEHLRHYWILHRFNRAKNTIVIGQAALLEEPSRRVQVYNRSLLLDRLNEADAFDVDLSPQERDRLQLTFTCAESSLLSLLTRHRKTKILTYGYVYTSGRWEEELFDHLEWKRRHDEEKLGKVQPALKGE